MSVNINADTTNGLVLTSDTTGEIKLQSAGADIATVDSSGITMASGKSIIGGGKVLQVVHNSSSGGSTSSTSFVDMGLSASITPSSTSSKVLVMANGIIRTAAVLRAGFSIVRGATNIQSATEMVITPSTLQNNSWYITQLDSPSTTSATTYKIQFSCKTGGTIYTNDAGSGVVGNINHIVLMEIAG